MDAAHDCGFSKARVPVPTKPEHDFFTALYESVPLDNSETLHYYYFFSEHRFITKVHHLYAFCRVCDPSTPKFKHLKTHLHALSSTQQDALLKKVILLKWTNPWALRYLREFLKQFPYENLVKELAVEAPEKLMALFELGYAISGEQLETMLVFGKSPSLSVELKRNILMPLIGNFIYDHDSYEKLKPIFELAATNWNHSKFGSALGEYTGYIPYSLGTILLLSNFGFNFNCKRKNRYFLSLQEARKVYTAYKLADDGSVLSILTKDVLWLLIDKILLASLPTYLSITFNHGNQPFQAHIPVIDTVFELKQRLCRQLGVKCDRWFLYQKGRELASDTLIESVDTKKGADLEFHNW